MKNLRNVCVFQHLLWISVFFYEIGVSKQQTFLEDVTLSHSQKQQLDQFKRLVSSFLPHAYMKEESYLVTWLRAQDFNLEAAKEMLYKNIKWREANDMDNILKEEWSSFEKGYRYSLEGCDLEGRPVIGINYGDWDFRKAVVTGKSQRLMRYMDKYLEEISVLIRRAQTQGQNVTKYVELSDLSHYSVQKHGCALCAPIYNYFYQTLSDHFPGTLHRSISINAPAFFQVQWTVLSPSLPKQVKDLVMIYGRDKSQWQSQLYKMISKDQLTWEFGGNKEFSIDLDQYRTTPNATFQCN